MFLVIGVVFVIGPTVTDGLVPGDLTDGRLNGYILEHDFRFFTGVIHHYWTGSFFYKFPLTTAFSDNLLGSAPLYAIFRLAGMDRYASFDAWYAAGFVLNYLAVYFSMRRLNFSSFSSGLGAFFYSFGMPSSAQDAHSQLVYRFATPIVLTELLIFYHRGKIRHLLWISILIATQFYCTVYMGFFLVMALLAEFTGILILWKFRMAGTSLWQYTRDIWESSRKREKLLVAGFSLASLVLVICLFLPYIAVVHIYHFNRSWEEISSMLPRLTSYLLADRSHIYGRFSHIFHGLPLRWEHQLFIGLAPILLVVIAFMPEHRKMLLKDLLLVSGISLTILFLLTISIGGVSIYRPISIIPGFSAIRSVTRIILVLMFFVALLVGRSWDVLVEQGQWGVRKVFFYIFAVGIVLESTSVWHLTFSKKEAAHRIEEIRLALPKSLPSRPILVIRNTGRNQFFTEVDGMVAAQTWGWKTLNGYTGNNPPGDATGDRGCGIIRGRILAYLRFKGKTTEANYSRISARIVPIGFQNCPDTWTKYPF